jgi:hypothetical protein
MSIIRSFLLTRYQEIDMSTKEGQIQIQIHIDKVIPVPDTDPGGFTKIVADIDARGFEGNFECKWEMQDADGVNCFPNKRWDFNIRFQVTFHTSDEGDTRG